MAQILHCNLLMTSGAAAGHASAPAGYKSTPCTDAYTPTVHRSTLTQAGILLT